MLQELKTGLADNIGILATGYTNRRNSEWAKISSRNRFQCGSRCLFSILSNLFAQLRKNSENRNWRCDAFSGKSLPIGNLKIIRKNKLFIIHQACTLCSDPPCFRKNKTLPTRENYLLPGLNPIYINYASLNDDTFILCLLFPTDHTMVIKF